MSCYVRLMRKEDVSQVIEVDHEAFPTMWPPPNYGRELQNRLAHYIVAYDDEETVTEPKAAAPVEKGTLTSRVKRLFGKYRLFSKEQPAAQHIMGFAGFWIMADEAHLTNIAVREIHRRQGTGELLLIAVIDMSTALSAHILTLEVRVSNTVAQKLYYKYGFNQVGIRRGYYLDNKEDAALMSIGDLQSTAFQEKLIGLKKAHSKRWGIPLYQIIQ
ncbi:ribosomal protein S18-alanine N-acetyltransferase [Chloroflexota bacterium]